MKSTGLDQSNETEVVFGMEFTSTFSCAFCLFLSIFINRKRNAMFVNS